MNVILGVQVGTTVAWTGAWGLMIGSTVQDSPIMMGWALFLTLIACLMTGCLVVRTMVRAIVRNERLRLERVADVVMGVRRSDTGGTVRSL